LRAGAPFVAIDFETADPGRDSARCVGLVRVEGGSVVGREKRLIRPPRRDFFFTDIHGIRWQDVAGAPAFAEVWPSLSSFLAGAEFFAAHNATFDRSVLEACCAAARLPPPRLPFQCSMKLARRAWHIYPTRLPDVCARLRIPLRHHDALSDAEACAHIVVEALRVSARPASEVARQGASSGATHRSHRAGHVIDPALASDPLGVDGEARAGDPRRVG
jgi:DNA polymerase-3 subunit epsilon